MANPDYDAGFKAGVDSLYNQVDAPSYVQLVSDPHVYSRLPVSQPHLVRALINETQRHWQKLLTFYYRADLQRGVLPEEAQRRDMLRRDRILWAIHEADRAENVPTTTNDKDADGA